VAAHLLALIIYSFARFEVALHGISVTIDKTRFTQDNNAAVSFTFADAEIGTTRFILFQVAGGGNGLFPVTGT